MNRIGARRVASQKLRRADDLRRAFFNAATLIANAPPTTGGKSILFMNALRRKLGWTRHRSIVGNSYRLNIFFG
jgi:hypothetical protein